METQEQDSASDSRKRKRQTAAACERCRRLKAKCDGSRPSCTKCIGQLTECVYTISEGETRHQASKAKLKKMEDDFNSMRKVLDHLRRSSSTSAGQILDGMRESDDSLAFARLFAAHAKSPPGLLHPRDMFSYRSPDFTSRTDSTYGTKSPSILRSVTPTNAVRLSREDRTFIGRFEGLPGRFEIPSETLFRVAISSFHQGAGKLFHVCPEDQIESSFDQVFRADGDQQCPASSLCRLSCMAAVGCLYLPGDNSDGAPKGDFYHIARLLFDRCLETGSLASANFCTLIAMYHVMSRATVALAYVELGISFCRQHDIHSAHRPPNMTPQEWLAGRRAWRCLLFLGTWISATIGYMSGNEWDLPGGSNFSVLEDSTDSELEDMVQVQMVKIAVLKRNILHLDVDSPYSAVHTIDTIGRDLANWHQDLPLRMQLSHLLEDAKTAYTTELRYTIFLCHCLYLGAIMLFHRRAAIQVARSEPDRVLGAPLAVSINKLGRDSVIAAEQTASILGLLLDQGGIFARCWIVLFQSYVAATVLLHNIARDNVQGASPNIRRHLETLDRVDTCMKILAICATVDPVAREFEKTLQQYCTKIRDAYNTNTSSHHAVPDWKEIEKELHYLVLMPYYKGGDHGVAGSLTQNSERYLPNHPLETSAGTGWRTSKDFHATLGPLPSDIEEVLPLNDLHSTSPVSETASTSKQDWESRTEDSSCAFLSSMVRRLQPARTLSDFSSCGWS